MKASPRDHRILSPGFELYDFDLTSAWQEETCFAKLAISVLCLEFINEACLVRAASRAFWIGMRPHRQ